jgi:hypothetical protein
MLHLPGGSAIIGVSTANDLMPSSPIGDETPLLNVTMVKNGNKDANQ